MKRIIKYKYFFILSIVILLLTESCTVEKESLPEFYKTENVIVVVIDGPRFSETWGDISHQFIPQMANVISKSGVVNTQFFNNGETRTVPGHTSITTGVYQNIDNTGKELPIYPSFFQYWNAENQAYKNLSWMICSKDKLEVLSNCSLLNFYNKHQPQVDCGIDGLGSGYRHDSITLKRVISTLEEKKPRLLLVNFRDPDFLAHKSTWEDYLNGIKRSDEYAYRIWEYLQKDEYYNGKTTLFITNDHGRHLDGIDDGFHDHGDECIGCKHIFLFASGPDFLHDTIINEPRELVDITATIAELLGIEMKHVEGEVMRELFR